VARVLYAEWAIIVTERSHIVMHTAFANVALAIFGIVFATAGLGLGILIGIVISKNRRY